MASLSRPPPSSPPQLRYADDALEKLRQELLDDSGDDSSLAENMEHRLDAIFTTDDVDGPTDFTANFSYWMNHADLGVRNPTDEIIPSEVEHDKALKDMFNQGDVVVDVASLEAPSPINGGLKVEDPGSEDEELGEEETSWLGAEERAARDADEEDKPIVHDLQRLNHQPFVEDATDLPTGLEHENEPRSLPAQESHERLEITPANDFKENQTLSNAELREAENVHENLKIPQMQVEALVEEVEKLRLKLESALHALTQVNASYSISKKTDSVENHDDYQREQREHNNAVFDKLNVLQELNVAQSKTVQAELLTVQQSVKTSIEDLREDVLQCQDELASVREGQVQALNQRAIEEELRKELAASRAEQEDFRSRNAILSSQLDEAKLRNEELERDRLLMSRVLLKEWGQQDCGVSKPQRYRYKFATG